VEGNTVSYAGGHNAINVQKATNIKILNNDVSEWNHNGLDTKMSDGILYRSNKAHDAPQGNGIYSEQSANITVENNSIYNIGGSTNGNSNGVHIEPARGQIVIDGNSISNAYGGIYLVRTSATVQSNSVSTRSGLNLMQR
jgi:parallel beta-helix repeat protein